MFPTIAARRWFAVACLIVPAAVRAAPPSLPTGEPGSAPAPPAAPTTERRVTHTLELTRERALALASARAPALAAARARIDEERAQLGGAAAPAENPEIEFLAGRRDAAGEQFTDLELAIEQALPLGQRAARRRGARAGLERELASADDLRRTLLADTATAFYRLLHAQERLTLARSAAALSDGVFAAIERRHAAGELSELERHLARVARARSHGELGQAEAAQLAAAGTLQRLLGVDAELVARGRLSDFPDHALAALVRRGLQRPDLRVHRAEADQAAAQVALGGWQRWPELGLRIELRREADEELLLAGLRARLPLFERGQAQVEAGRARQQRARIEETALRTALPGRVRGVLAVYRRLAAASRSYDAELTGALADGEALAARSFAHGQIAVADYLVVQRELLEARRVQLDLQLDASLARVALESEAGVLP
jgi:outer membrane protein TolC